jgi:hypothetical protein
MAEPEQVPFVGSQVPALWQASTGVQITGLLPVQTPAWHVSVWVQALLSLQALPSGWGAGVEQVPLIGSQVPAT